MATRKAAPAEAGAIEVAVIRKGRVTIRIVGDSPLVVNAFDAKTLQQIEDKQTGKATAGRVAKDITDGFMRSLHVLPAIPADNWDGKAILHDDEAANREAGLGGEFATYATGRFGFRSCGIKASLVRAGKYLNFRMTDLQCAFHINGEYQEIIPKNPENGPIMRRDMVRVANGNPDVRFRGEFPSGWEITFTVEYMKSMVSVQHIVQMCRQAGFGVGLGEWRREKGGSWGGFQVIEVTELEDVNL